MPKSYCHLTYEERCQIEALKKSQQFPITFKLSGPAPNLGVRHGSVVAGARWGHSNTIQAAAWLVKLR